jgi:thioredoxin 1
MSDIAGEPYQPEKITRDEVNAVKGMMALDFGANWCGHCKAGRGTIVNWMTQHASVDVVHVADGKGCPLGRTFKVKLWPTVILLKDGAEVSRVVRPVSDDDMQPLTKAIKETSQL